MKLPIMKFLRNLQKGTNLLWYLAIDFIISML